MLEFDVVSLPLLLISGIPGSGKTSFCEWLARTHGFLHFDLDDPDAAFETHPSLGRAWEHCFVDSSNVRRFVELLQEANRPVVLDWGFPPASLHVVQQLSAWGVSAWWFEGDLAAARAAFCRRATVSMEALHRQLEALDVARPALEHFYGERVIRTVSDEEAFRSPEAIYQQLFAAVA